MRKDKSDKVLVLLQQSILLILVHPGTNDGSDTQPIATTDAASKLYVLNFNVISSFCTL